MESVQEKKRESNFELLRIFSIILVILSHFNVHSNILLNSVNDVNFNWVLKSFFSTGCIANICFILITGYFMVKSKPNYKKIIGLILDMMFYSYIVFIILLLFKKIEFNFGTVIKDAFPMLFGNWFCIYYIILYLFIPVLNTLLNTLDKKNLEKVIILMLILFSIIPSFIGSDVLGFTNHAIFLVSYLIGGYIRLYLDKPINKKKAKKILVLDVIFLLMSVIIFIFLGKYFNNLKFINMSTHFIANNKSIFIIILSICIFLLFKDLKIKYNKVINSISSSVLGIYLIHENEHIKPIIWNEIIPGGNFYNDWKFSLIGLMKVICVFLICLVIDKIRNALFGKVKKYLVDKIYNICNKIYNLFIEKITKFCQ